MLVVVTWVLAASFVRLLSMFMLDLLLSNFVGLQPQREVVATAVHLHC